MERTKEALAVGLLLIVATLGTLYAVQTFFVNPPAAPTPTVREVVPPEPAPAPVPAAPVAALTPATPLESEPLPAPTTPAKPAESAPPQLMVTPAPAQTAHPPSRPRSEAGTPATPAPAPTPLARGRQLTDQLYGGQLKQLWAAFLPALRAEWGSFSAFQAYRAGGLKAYGAETGVLKEEVAQDGGLTYYTRTSTFERGPRTGWTLIFGLDTQGRVREFGIVGAGLLPEAQHPATP
ncbi:hypothetical protein E5F05_14065 [Deinococcus metallilatus]|uniref:Uncharacterized protein n=1 Tax=Deinococcus metallilatus TaxID=1211322 RepID=A0AAJ5F709_9DEIO|nr:hypothetical protein [Deinococcus metallilatus]MBB5294194.1 hypothetical protein [Deinococcus metallilatus]QBY08973.1 hypothetical protein E5F05_14065 [Deinococcus metallilatus]RXJ10117.1 hypothetical protein ERJ73_12895 [Deinococcus metallilatus]TLK27946.1 hypothetical protein FCS05_08485 [Deinococcus metallilatus]GMA16469.1 hypothetical protein GCM10025871_28000 [Deinococcus metallilatus]